MPGWPPVWQLVAHLVVVFSLVALMNRVLAVLEPRLGTVWAYALLGALLLGAAFAGRAAVTAWRARNDGPA